MEVIVNQKKINVPEESTVKDVILAAGIATGGIAVAVNGAVINASAFASTPVHESDSLIVIKAFYGG